MVIRKDIINSLIDWDKGGYSHKVRANELKIDFFKKSDKYYLEVGVAYLEKKLKKEQIQDRIWGRLERLEDLWQK